MSSFFLTCGHNNQGRYDNATTYYTLHYLYRKKSEGKVIPVL